MWWPERIRFSFGQDRLRVGITGSRLVLARGRGEGTSSWCEQTDIHPHAADDHPSWRPALQALAAFLKDGSDHRPVAAGNRPSRSPYRRVEVVLGGSHVRWKLIDLPPQLRKPGEREAVAQHHFRDSLGSDACHWRVQLVDQPRGWMTPVCAVDGRLIDELDEVCKTARSSLASIRPYFSTAYDYWRTRLRGDSLWFAVQDDDAICLALIRGGCWAGLNARPAVGDWREQIGAMQAQIAIPAGFDASAVPLHLVTGDAASTARPSSLGTTLRMQPPNWTRDTLRCRMAYGL